MPCDRLFGQDGQLRCSALGKLVRGPMPPAANKVGWDDTVRVDPGTIAGIIVKFEGYTGRCVCHCHLLEHAANEVMRPLEVVARQRSG